MSAASTAGAAERSVLASVLHTPSCLASILSEIDSGDFYSRHNAVVFDALRSLHERGEPIDTITVRQWLTDSKQLSQAGGDEHLLALTSDVPAVEHVVHHARIVREKANERRTREEARAAILALDAGDMSRARSALATAQSHAAAVGRRPVEVRSLRDTGFDPEAAPPDPQWSWTRVDPDDGLDVGVVERGIVGMLVGYPGVGKSTITLAAGISISCGVDWLGWQPPPTPGRVLFATAEETDLQVHRRVYRALRALGLSAQQRERVLDNFFPWSLRGADATLVHGEGKDYAPTPFSLSLRQHVDERGYDLVIVDPLSRFAGPDTETSNAAGTAFVRELEALTRTRTEPTVLFSHHVSKGADLTSMFAARGSSSLSGGVKWQANIQRIEANGRTWGVSILATKSNYAPEPPKTFLRWEGDSLRLASQSEFNAIDASKAANASRAAKRDAA